MSTSSQPSRDFPMEIIAFTAIITSIFGLSIPSNYLGMPAYARVSLLMIALNNLFPSLKQWLELHNINNEHHQFDQQTMDLLQNHTSLSISKVIINSFQRKLGIEKCYICIIYLCIACYAPQLTFMILKLQLLRIISMEVTILIYRPFYYNSKYLHIEIPSNHAHYYSFFVDISMVSIPLLYAYNQGHI